MSELKRLHRDAIPAALEKAERYRLLNEPGEAESICLDILNIDPENQQAIITLLLALTDRFEKGYAVSDTQTKELLSRMKLEYDRAYYTGIVAERRAKTKLRQNTPDCRFQAYDLFREAMDWFEKAEAVRPPENDDALLRWNTCARIIARNNLVAREPEERIELPELISAPPPSQVPQGHGQTRGRNTDALRVTLDDHHPFALSGTRRGSQRTGFLPSAFPARSTG